MRHLEQVIYQNERFSKHGRYFSPFFESLAHSPEPDEYSETGQHPLLVCLPFVDWTVVGETPPLRFQIDPREGFQSSRTSVHLIRSLLQHFYRLEDTHDREQSQVFANHRPWTADTNLDLKVRRWYGHYPESLNVDELWILVVDAQHIITFASNQSWKSRWPPLQLASRIAEVSFRSVRNDFFTLSNSDYTAYHHLVTCLNGAVGLLHRSFWPDMPLCIADRYAGYLEHVVSHPTSFSNSIGASFPKFMSYYLAYITDQSRFPFTAAVEIINAATIKFLLCLVRNRTNGL